MCDSNYGEKPALYEQDRLESKRLLYMLRVADLHRARLH